MTVQEAKALRRGNVVQWEDPAAQEFPDEDCGRMDVIFHAEIQDSDEVDAIVFIKWEDGAELECFANELTKITD